MLCYFCTSFSRPCYVSQSVVNHIWLFSGFFQLLTWHWGNHKEFHSPSKHRGLRCFSISQFWPATRNGARGLCAATLCQQHPSPVGFFSPFATEIFHFLFLYFIRQEILLNLNVNTKHSSLTLYPHFSFHEKQSKEAENGFFLGSPQNTSSSGFQDPKMLYISKANMEKIPNLNP